MEKKINEIGQEQEDSPKISRKQAIKKAGFMAVSAATMMVMLSNNAAARGKHGGGRPGRRPGRPGRPGGKPGGDPKCSPGF